MRRFRLLFVVFALALLALVGLLVDRTLRGLALERQMRHQAVAERLFDEMERGLSRLLEREEQRSLEDSGTDVQGPPFPFVIGYFQVDPDGRLHSEPATDDASGTPSAAQRRTTAAEIERALAATGHPAQRAANAPAAIGAQTPGSTLDLGARAQPEAKTAPAAGGSARGVSAFDALRYLNKGVEQRAERQKQLQMAQSESVPPAAAAPEPARKDEGRAAGEMARARPKAAPAPMERAPFTGHIIDDRHLLLSRTLVSGAQAYRQGVLIDVEQLQTWLRAQGLGSDGPDGLATYASVSFATPFSGAPAPADTAAFVYQHRFAEPFADLTARLRLRPLPGVASVTYVYALCALLLGTAALGLGALYRMVSVVVSYAERRGNFVAAVSHELKTPLTAIRMYGEMLRDGMVPSEAKREEYYRHITGESERLSRLINNVLELSRLEKGTREMGLVVGAVAPVVQEVADLLRAHVEGQGFALAVEVDADLPPVRFERDALMQVLWNLVDNAVKYGGGGPAKRIVVRARRDGGSVCVGVRDSGPGVPPRHLGKIFEPFYRGESELTRRSKGVGLGLALVRGLAERMGARLSGRNLPDGGFEVEVAFRAAA